MFKTYIFIDFETTELLNPVVTEMSVIAIDRVNYDRVIDKLVMCFNPDGRAIQPTASAMTGLTNDMLKNRKSFMTTGVNMLTEFIKAQPTPSCLLAHNGDQFDFDIIKSVDLPENVYTLDTLTLFRDMNVEKGLGFGSYRLADIYNHLFDHSPPNSHSAESDCVTLMKCFIEAGCVNYIDKSYRPPR